MSRDFKGTALMSSQTTPDINSRYSDTGLKDAAVIRVRAGHHDRDSSTPYSEGIVFKTSARRTDILTRRS
jgi:hypothetical protein